MCSPQKVYIAVLGTGGVGRAFLNQLARLTSSTHPHLILTLLSRSTSTLTALNFDTALPPSTLTSFSPSTHPALSPSAIITYLSSAPGPCILVDNTSSQAIADAYPAFLTAGIHVITPNKKAFSGPLALWRAIAAAQRSPQNPRGGLVFHESSVGAGLPVLSTLRELVATGDEVVRIEGVFSGTMSFLFNGFAPAEGGGAGGRWSEEVERAKEMGFTEPDAREDLNGLDVARKLVILARGAGVMVEGTGGVEVESLVPRELEGCASGEEFLKELAAFDGVMERVREEAEREGKMVRYVGSVDVGSGRVRCGLERLDRGHPIVGLKGSDNIINFHTKRYAARPLVIMGAGAGGEVTAMGVTGDLLKVLERI